jgi:hypothetical protein
MTAQQEKDPFRDQHEKQEPKVVPKENGKTAATTTTTTVQRSEPGDIRDAHTWIELTYESLDQLDSVWCRDMNRFLYDMDGASQDSKEVENADFGRAGGVSSFRGVTRAWFEGMPVCHVELMNSFDAVFS